jgi:hypothetical protein
MALRQEMLMALKANAPDGTSLGYHTALKKLKGKP